MRYVSKVDNYFNMASVVNTDTMCVEEYSFDDLKSLVASGERIKGVGLSSDGSCHVVPFYDANRSKYHLAFDLSVEADGNILHKLIFNSTFDSEIVLRLSDLCYDISADFVIGGCSNIYIRVILDNDVAGSFTRVSFLRYLISACEHTKSKIVVDASDIDDYSSLYNICNLLYSDTTDMTIDTGDYCESISIISRQDNIEELIISKNFEAAFLVARYMSVVDVTTQTNYVVVMCLKFFFAIIGEFYDKMDKDFFDSLDYILLELFRSGSNIYFPQAMSSMSAHTELDVEYAKYIIGRSYFWTVDNFKSVLFKQFINTGAKTLSLRERFSVVMEHAMKATKSQYSCDIFLVYFMIGGKNQMIFDNMMTGLRSLV